MSKRFLGVLKNSFLEEDSIVESVSVSNVHILEECIKNDVALCIVDIGEISMLGGRVQVVDNDKDGFIVNIDGVLHRFTYGDSVLLYNGILAISHVIGEFMLLYARVIGSYLFLVVLGSGYKEHKAVFIFSLKSNKLAHIHSCIEGQDSRIYNAGIDARIRKLLK